MTRQAGANELRSNPTTAASAAGGAGPPGSDTKLLAAWPSGGSLVPATSRRAAGSLSPETSADAGSLLRTVSDSNSVDSSSVVVTSGTAVPLHPPPAPPAQLPPIMATNKVIPAGRRHSNEGERKLAPVMEPLPPSTAPTPAWKKSALNLLSVRQTGNPLHVRMLAFLDGRLVTIVMTGFIIYALFGDDLRIAVFPKSADDVFFSLSLIALILFFIELFLNSVARQDYVFRFYFWLDLLATLSLIPDIGWFWDPIVGTGDDSNNADTGTSAIQAGRSARAGTKAGRIVRIVRLVRLIRIVKLYKHVNGKQKEGGDGVANEPSQVGKILADLTTRRLIVLVLAMVLVLPFFNPNGLEDTLNQHETLGLITLHRLQFAQLSQVCVWGGG